MGLPKTKTGRRRNWDSNSNNNNFGINQNLATGHRALVDKVTQLVGKALVILDGAVEKQTIFRSRHGTN